jgi:hypothetical protein
MSIALERAPRVLRGASWYIDDRDYLLSSARGYALPGLRREYIGFRCVVGASSP